MTKRILAAFLAVLMAFGALVFVVAAADEPEKPEEPEKPAYTPVEYQISDLIDAAGKKNVYLQPTDIILLPGAPKPSDAGEEAEGETPAETEDAEAAQGNLLIVEYLPGEGIPSEKAYIRFVDYGSSGYAIHAIGDNTDYAYTASARASGVGTFMIDYTHKKEYPFKQWRIRSIYSDKKFSRIVLEADWEQPTLVGWEGYKTLIRGYLKTIIEYFKAYLEEWFTLLSNFMVGTPT